MINTITKTGYSRKIDNMGRIGIPKSIRDRYGAASGKEYEIALFTDEQGDDWLCLKLGKDITEIEKARRAMEYLKTVPQSVLDEIAD